jgi:hypothetical protein
MPFIKGVSGNPLGRRKVSPVTAWNIKQAARDNCEEALNVIAHCLRSADEKIRLMAASLMLDRGYGKPEQRVDAEVTHRFAEVPQVMPKDQWIANRGVPQLAPPDPNRKLN